MNRPKQTSRLTRMGIITAILLIQNMIPFLGNIPIPPLNPTIIHVTVIVVALSMGMKDGMIAGLIWGLIRLFRAFAMPATPLDPLIWVNPIITIVPRLLIGTTTVLTYQLLHNKVRNNKLSMGVASFIGSMTNTLLVMLFIYLFFNAEIGQAMGIDASNLGYALLVIIVTSGLAEAVLAAVLAPIVVQALKRLRR
ncbi:Pantothenic acid ECF transporter S component PanT [Alloiococcus otitis]|uniref:ECF transporter S component n=1 Tax=Alloiococcus otitis ATCC 51267 TaxID=883081 RepID=K9ESS8_9LACT|nr:ECF transporter S component [Alloiococcus otitis]EKU94007.1 hypothetical protein HMPREF9698_00487 [Alloiococcus otitis ATCC 51267]SUU80908.1 Pantothenic acid ECF transporter S component PanT [Alloiococcus otitis]